MNIKKIKVTGRLITLVRGGEIWMDIELGQEKNGNFLYLSDVLDKEKEDNEDLTLTVTIEIVKRRKHGRN